MYRQKIKTSYNLSIMCKNNELYADILIFQQKKKLFRLNYTIFAT
jgi:hypothetical protein